MRSKIAKFAVVAALVLTTGLHWAALQTIAWTTMLAANLGTNNLSEAVAKTFDGNHPCPLCKAIAAAKKSEHKSEAVQAQLKFEFLPMAQQMVIIAPAPAKIDRWESFLFPQLNTEPLLPPPREQIS